MRLKDFYADPQRASSEEVDFGSSWRTQGERPWKVVWLAATGELVAFNEQVERYYPTAKRGGAQDWSDLPVVVGVEAVTSILMGTDNSRRRATDEVVVIGVEPDLPRLRGALIGWEEHVPEENGLAWLAERGNELSRGHAG